MLRSLGGIGGILAQTWPALVAWFLVGQLVRAIVISIAAPIGPDNPLAALLLVPLIPLARLTSYIGMFLVLRRALPGYRALAGSDVVFTTVRDSIAEFLRVLLVTIGPFFTLYALMGLLGDDLSDYAGEAFRFAGIGDKSHVLNVGDGPLVLIVVVVAFAARMMLKALGPRLPEWTAIAGIYLEATWVFVALTAIGTLFGGITEWINNRQIVQWVSDTREFLVSLADPLRFVIEGVDWLTPVALQLVLLPLSWLFIASIIYIRALGNVVEDGPAPTDRIASTVGSRMPAVMRRYGYLFTGTWDEIGKPLVFSSRIVLRAGLANLAFFLAAYAVLYALTQWIVRGVYYLIGGHDSGDVFIVNDVVSVAAGAFAEPVRIVLLAAAFSYCLLRWSERPSARGLVEPVSAVTRPEPDRT